MKLLFNSMLLLSVATMSDGQQHHQQQQQQQQQFLLQENKQRGNLRGLEQIENCGADGSCSDESFCDSSNNICVQCWGGRDTYYDNPGYCERKFIDVDCHIECWRTQDTVPKILQCYTDCPVPPQVAECIAGCFPPTFVPIEPVLLLAAGKFAILTKTGVTTTGVTSVTGDIGSSPIAISSNTGFSMALDSGSGGAFSTSNLVDGEMYGADHAVPTPSMLTGAVGAMELAYTTAAGRVGPDFTELGGGNIEGKTLEPGLYKWGTGVGITSSLVFNGPEDAVWILQVAGDVTIGTGAQMILQGGAKANNIFWQVAGQTTFGTGTENKGIFLCKTAIVFTTGSSLIGAALAQTAVTLDAATIVKNSVCDTGASYSC